jgi:hypothetical protein
MIYPSAKLFRLAGMGAMTLDAVVALPAVFNFAAEMPVKVLPRCANHSV